MTRIERSDRPSGSPLPSPVVLAALALLLVAPATRAEDLASKPRVAHGDLGLVLVPWGMAYTRAGAGLNFSYKIPLIQQPGILWDSTNITFGASDFYGFVNNSAAAFVEITPIAFFKLQVSAGYDLFIVDPFSGGVRVLTDLGRQRLAEGRMGRGTPGALDWAEGQDDRSLFEAPIGGDGLRLKVAPTLQAKFGPVGIQYNYTADFNFYRAGSHGPDAIINDTFTQTLQKMRDLLHVHELTVAVDVPGVGKEMLAGVTTKYYQVAGTGLNNLNINALLFYRPGVEWFGPGTSPWAAAQVGTHLIDPMYQYDFSWVVVLGLDWKLL